MLFLEGCCISKEFFQNTWNLVGGVVSVGPRKGGMITSQNSAVFVAIDRAGACWTQCIPMNCCHRTISSCSCRLWHIHMLHLSNFNILRNIILWKPGLRKLIQATDTVFCLSQSLKRHMTQFSRPHNVLV